ncbi:MAG: biotin--[acetyl-CoA-carboxylase] ligase [Planctomycetota bacterium]
MVPREAILLTLYDRDEYVAPDELASAAGVDRAGLDAALDELRRGGWKAACEPGRGVRLVRPVRPAAVLVERELHTRRVGRGVLCFDAVDSTNDVAAAAAPQGDADGLCVLAEFQRRGRGRMGRSWVSPHGANLLMSVLLCDPLPPREALTVAAGLSVADGIEHVCGLRCGLKWPNDVELDGRKLAGVIVEAPAAGDCLVVGAGVNVGAAPPGEAIHGAAACLADAVGYPVERVELARAILRRLDAWVDAACRGRLDELHARWVGRCEMVNRRVAVRAGRRRHVGRVLDVSPTEGLVLACDNGRRVHIPAAGATLVP